MSRLSKLLVVGICLAVVVGPATAATATVAIDSQSTVESGETVTVSLTLTNTGDSSDFYLLDLSTPEGWSVVDHSDDGGDWDGDDVTWIFLSVDADGSVQPSVTFETTGRSGTADLTATAENGSSIRDIATHSITVESEPDDGGGGGGGGGGGFDYDDEQTESGGTETPQPTTTDEPVQTPAEYDTDSESELETTEGTNSSYDAVGSTPTGTPGDASNGTGERDQSSTDSDLLSSGPGLGIGLLGMLLVVGGAVVTVRRKGSDVFALGGGSTTESDSADAGAADADADLSAVEDALAEADIDTVDLQATQTGNTLAYTTSATTDDEAKVEIRTIVRCYLSATDAADGYTSLEATVLDGNEAMGTWYIRSEWLAQHADGTLSSADLEERVFETADRSS